MDMASGGSTKVAGKEYIYIELPEDEAIQVFEQMFNHNPYNVTCDCCGGDYSIRDYDTIEDATNYDRRSSTQSVEDYCKRDDVLVIRKSDIVEDC
jgi:hypothetical protein